MNIKFANWNGNAPSPIAMELAKKAGVQEAPVNYQDYMASREPANTAKARMEANTEYQIPDKGKFAPSQDYTSVSMSPKFETNEQAKARTDEADTRAYQQSHPGLSSDFASKIAEILRQGKAMEQSYRDSANGTFTPKTMGQIAQERMANIPADQKWRRQNPFAEGMGYQWADDAKMKAAGWGDDDIASMKARTEFEPQEVLNLVDQGIIRAPYAEYLKEQERLRQEALAKAAQEAYDYSEPTYYETPASSVSAPAPAPQQSYGVGFDQLDSDSMADFKKGNQAGWNWTPGRNNFY
jgi:hypothetical protein|nr:MAG TPA: hypothetical protein [Caudoviricetes sp.]